MNKFPTTVELHKIRFVEPQPSRKDELKKFWVLYAGLGAVMAFVLCVLTNANVFLPAWGLSTLVIWAVCDSQKKEKERSTSDCFL